MSCSDVIRIYVAKSIVGVVTVYLLIQLSCAKVRFGTVRYRFELHLARFLSLSLSLPISIFPLPFQPICVEAEKTGPKICSV